MSATVALCQTVCICFQSFTQCHIPKVVTVILQRYTVKSPQAFPLSSASPDTEPTTAAATAAAAASLSPPTDRIFFLCFCLCFLCLLHFSSCLLAVCFLFSRHLSFLPSLLPSHPPSLPSFSVPADSPAVGSRHVPQSVSPVIPGPDLKGSLKDESLYTVPDFVK